MTEIKQEDIQALEEARSTAILAKTNMVAITKIYNRYHTEEDQINVKGCTFCSKVKRKIYFNIIYNWFDEARN